MGRDKWDCIEILKELISLDTANPPGNEKAAAEYLASVLEPFGFLCQVQDLGNQRANLIAIMEAGEGPELMLNGHLDVVPAQGDWHCPPFCLTAKGDRLYGRGTADMKGGIAAMCEAAMRMAEEGGPENGRLKLLFTADEECSNLGISSYMEQYPMEQCPTGQYASEQYPAGRKKAGQCPSGRYAVIGEPTGLEVAIAHRGVSRDYIDIRGEARHGALPAGDCDAVEKAAWAVLALGEWNRELGKMSHPVLPPPGIAVTMIQGYEKDNIVPGNVRLLTDFRLLPGMSREQAAGLLDQGLLKAGLEDYTISPHFYMPGGELCAEDDFVKLCVKEAEGLFGGRKQPRAFEASCEQCFFVSHGVKAVICGPGDMGQAHRVDEYTSEKQVRDAVELYGRMMKRILCKDKCLGK